MVNNRQRVNQSEVINFGILGGIGEAVYIFLIASLMSFFEKTTPPEPPAPLGPMLFLLLFVFSAAISAVLVFGFPAYLAFQKRFAEAFMTVAVTMSTLLVIGLFIFLLLPIL